LNLADAGILRAFLKRHGIDPAKGLGQHFLVSRRAVDAIVGAAGDVRSALEIGPGPGVLTSALSAKIGRVVALELDARMIALLQESAPNAEVRRANALESDLSTLLAELPAPRALVSNLPYYITGPLLTRIAEARGQFDVAVLMMQREVGQRVLAPAKTSARGSLSVYLQIQFEIRKVVQVPAGSFLPPPKVDSLVLAFTPRETGLSVDEEEFFFRMLRLAFAQPRKTLANNLSAGLHVPRELALRALERSDLGEKARPQELTVEEWISLARATRAEMAGDARG
jgi:16S rRNA (adenine1518-N6/adenine1519-N6)-dimethyltransferase